MAKKKGSKNEKPRGKGKRKLLAKAEQKVQEQPKR